MAERVVCVLGMHRSGTSALAGTLEQAGVALGPVSTWNRFNEKGNREHPEIMRLHEQLLAEAGGSWDRPPAEVAWRDPHRAVRDAIIAGLAQNPIWGFKDPRTLFTLDGWREALPGLALVGIFRHPRAVAASLARRNSFPAERSLALWERYNGRLLALHRASPFPLLSFDLAPPALDAALRSAIAALGLPPPPPRLDFFDEALRHMRPDDAPLPAAAAALHRELLARAI